MWTLNKPEEVIKELENEFNQLNSIEEKFLFWSEKLGTPFYKSSTCAFIVNFPIDGKTEDETEKINLLNHKQYSESVDLLNKIVYDIDKMKNSFQENFVNIINQREFLEFEIKSLEKRVSERDGHIDQLHESTNSFFDKGYKDFYFENKKPDLGHGVYEIFKLIALKNGYVFAQYHNYLKGLLNNLVAKDVRKTKLEKETTTNQQLLILYYLDILEFLKFDENTKRAKLYSTLLNRSMKNVYDGLTYINGKAKGSKYKTGTNLLTILPLFEELGLTKAVNKIKADLAELKIDKTL